jgi:phospho-N-acetylmuramoyl-pentapeptide-transferase
MVIDILKVILPATFSFGIGIFITPFLTHFLYKYRLWKKTPGKQAGIGGGGTPIFNELHKEKEVGTPRMGGIIIWASSLLTILGIWVLALLFPNETTTKFDFLSRDQTWIPLFTLLLGSLVGLWDDFLEIRGNGGHKAGGLSLRGRLLLVAGIALFVGSWLYFKLDVVTLGIPFYEDLFVGIFLIPIFILVTLALYAGGVIDGIDGLSGGVFSSIFVAYAGIAFYQEQINLAAFSAMLSGAILAFLWFNIPPARFYMSETGTMGLTLTLAVVAFMTDALGGGEGVLLLPIIAFPLLITVGSNILQVLSKKIRNKKIFLVAPLHHHFEAKGWPGYKVTMRYWILSIIFALIGFVIALIG